MLPWAGNPLTKGDYKMYIIQFESNAQAAYATMRLDKFSVVDDIEIYPKVIQVNEDGLFTLQKYYNLEQHDSETFRVVSEK
jgi:hypothetical protein